MQSPPALPTAHTPSWWARNWKWMTALGVFLILALGFGFFTGILAFMRNSDAYQGAMVRVKASPQVAQSLGAPVKDGFFFTGTINKSIRGGRANLMIPLHGSKGSGVMQVDSTFSGGRWHYNTLVVQITESKQIVDLSEK